MSKQETRINEPSGPLQFWSHVLNTKKKFKGKYFRLVSVFFLGWVYVSLYNVTATHRFIEHKACRDH